MNKRLMQFITAENISQSQFADNIGVARASVSHIIAGRNKPGFDFVEKMARAFPALNIEWLITGKGKMYKTALNEQVQPSSTNDDYATDLFGDAYRDSLIATTVVQNGNDLLDTAFVEGLKPAEEADEQAAPKRREIRTESNKQPSAQQAINQRNLHQRESQEFQGPDYADSIRKRQAAAPFGHSRNIAKIIVFYDDGSYQELK